MKQMLKYTLIGLLIVGLVGITAVGVAYAQGDPPHPLETLADLLGLTEDDLRDQLRDGKTLEDLATEAGIDLEEFKESLQITWEENFKARVQEAIDNEDIGQDQGDWLLEGLEKGFLGGGHWFGDRHGMGRFRDQDGSKPFGERPEFDGHGKPGSWGRIPGFNQ